MVWQADQPDLRPQLVSRPLYYRGELSGWGGNWVDGTTLRGSGPSSETKITTLPR
jgi:hypothetical protein